MENLRLNKYLAECGIASRREADKLIAAGRIRVNGDIADMGTKVTGEEEILFDGKRLKGKDPKVVLAYYKPYGVTCTTKDRHAKRTIEQEFSYPIPVTYAGRLDRDSEGLILLTNDGDLIDRIMRAVNRHEKEYIVEIKQEVSEEFLSRMSKGVYLHELDVTSRPCKIVKKSKCTFTIILTQGLNRQIRRMCSECGATVTKLKRVRIMNIQLNDLKSGEYRLIEGDELNELYRLSEKQL